MNITTNTVVTLDFSLHDANSGELIQSTKEQGPFHYFHGAGQIVPGLEEELEGKASGAHVVVEVPADKGFGERVEALQADVPKDKFEGVDQLEIGMQIQVQSPRGRHLARIVEIKEDAITLDANHPLAGKALAFEVEVRDVRAATAEEIQAIENPSSCCSGGTCGDGSCDEGDCGDSGSCCS